MSDLETENLIATLEGEVEFWKARAEKAEAAVEKAAEIANEWDGDAAAAIRAALKEQGQ